MNTELAWVLALLVAAVVMFAANRPRMDVVAVLVIVALPFTGVLTVPEVLSGFADPNVVLIAALFVIGEGLSRTGVTYRLGDWLAARAGTSSTRLLVLLMVCVAGLGAVMSSTGVVAIFIPVVLSTSALLRVSPRHLMMPLSFAGLISGMLTLIATAPNLVVDAELSRDGGEGFGFFTFTPFGVVVLALGIGYMLFVRRWLGDGRPEDAAGSRRRFQDLIDDYRLAGRERRLKVRLGSPLVGKTLEELDLRGEHGMSVVAVERRRGLFRTLAITTATDETRLARGDVLLADLVSRAADPDVLFRALGLKPLPLQHGFFTETSREVGMAEVILPPDSPALGSRVHDLRFRARYGVEAIGLRRSGRPITGEFTGERLALGDTLLVIGGWSQIRRLGSLDRAFVVLDLPAEVDEIAPAANRAPFAIASVLVMVVLMVTGIVPNVTAALIACLLMGAAGCITMTTAYRSIHWPTLLLIAGMLPFALALERTGGIDIAVDALVSTLGGAGFTVLLAGLFLTTAVIGLFISNTATAVLMAPVAIAMAVQLGASPYPFAMIVALAASSAFMTPVSSPVNTLVLGPGRYSFGDFLKVGAPFTVIVMIVSVIMVPLLLPLYPGS